MPNTKTQLLLTFLTFSILGFANPSNEDCNTATPITSNNSFTCSTVTAGTTVAAMASVTGCGSNSPDVWYSFVATGAISRIVLDNLTAVTGTPSDAGIEVYSGTCGNLTSVNCNSEYYSTTSGNTHYIRVYSENTSSHNFDVCIGTLATSAPANDECTNAITLPINNQDTCIQQTLGTTQGATQSQAPCYLTGNTDTWYTFTANAYSHNIQVNNVTPYFPATGEDLVIEILKGNACGSLTSLRCEEYWVSNSQGPLSFWPGETVYLRMNRTASSNVLTSYDFDLCITAMPPTNDEWLNADELYVNPDSCCMIATEGYNIGATESMPGCQGSAEDDLWFFFTATQANHDLSVDNIIELNSSNNDRIVMQVFEESNGSLSSMICYYHFGTNSNTINLTNLTIGDDYYVRAYGYYGFDNYSYELCVTTPPPSITNDICSGAIPVVSDALGYCQTYTYYEYTDANDSGALPNPTCSAYDGYDLWFTVQVPASGNLTIDVVWTHTLAGVLYSGTCGALVEAACVLSPNWPMQLSGLAPGSYYLRTFLSSPGPISNFMQLGICAFEPPPLPTTLCSGYNVSSPQSSIGFTYDTLQNCEGAYFVTDVEAIVEVSGDLDLLEINLISPHGRHVQLWYDECQFQTSNHLNVRFGDALPNSVLCDETLTTGTKQPITSLSALDGEYVSGAWVLELISLGGGNAVLEQWCLNYDLEFDIPNDVYVPVKVLLEGPYNYTSWLMKDNLRAGSILPVTSPYSGAPWSSCPGNPVGSWVYNTTGSDAIVDWVYLQIRDKNDSTKVITETTALLQADGDVVGIDGINPPIIEQLPFGNYYVVVDHRTHLPAMTATPVYLNLTDWGPGATIDLTTGNSFGVDGQKQMGNVYGLYEGDINQDNVINSADRSLLWNQANSIGYLGCDTNLDGVCDATDRSNAWNNRNIVAQVPSL